MIINRSQKPKPKQKIDFIIPKISYGSVDNIEYYHVEKNRFPIVNMIIMQNFGFRLDTEGKRGLTFLAFKMLSKGSGKYNSLEFNERLQFLGASYEQMFNENDSVIVAQSITENFDETFELFADSLFSPHLEEYDFETEKKNLISSLEYAKKDPESLFMTAVNRVFGKGTSIEYNFNGFIEDVETITIDDIRNYYNNIINKSKITLFFTGDISKSKIEALITKYLLKRNDTLITPESIYNNTPFAKKLYYMNFEGKPQTILGMSIKIPHFKTLDRFSLNIAVNILGGNFTSRLNSKLREEKGFTYGISASKEYHYDAGFMNIFTSVDTQKTVEAIKEIYNEVAKMNEDILEEEVAFVKSNLINHFPLRFTTLRSINVGLASLIREGMPIDTWDNYTDEIAKRNLEDVIALVKKYFDVNKMATVLVGDKNQIELDKLDIFEGIQELDYNGNEIN